MLGLEGMVWIRLGQWERARACARKLKVDPESNAPWSIRALMFIGQQLDAHDGKDPLPSMRELTALARSKGLVGVRLKHWEWEDQRLSLAPEERPAAGEQLIVALRQANIPSSMPALLLQVAEASREAGRASARALALEAASELRRGRTSFYLYLPDGLVRCARLLQSSDPGVANALMHVARRWVRQALPHVPEFARESFVHEVPVNRLLLGEAT